MSSNTIASPEETREATEAQATLDLPRPQGLRMTFEEFLVWDGEATMAEWVDGEVFVMSPVAEQHQEIIAFLIKVLGLHVEIHGLGKLLFAPYVMRLPGGRRGREPDLLFVTRGRADLVKRTYLDGAADLAVEVVSPESVGRDRGEKFVEYEAAGVKEYWLLDPDREQAEFYELGADRRYRLAGLEAGVYHSRVVHNFFLRPAWLWQNPAPTIEALRELKLF